MVDDGGLYIFYADVDEDGYGDAGDFVESCSIPEGYVFNSDDCDDAASNISPSAEGFAMVLMTIAIRSR